MVKFGFFHFFVLISLFKDERAKEYKEKFIFIAYFKYLECIQKNVGGLEMIRVVLLEQGSAFLAHFGSFALFFYGMALFILGGDFFFMKIIRETTHTN
jgi:hypothetical protein